MSSIRKAAVAGSFYPSDPILLRNQIRGLLSHAKTQAPRLPKAMVVPHAGYVYSGPIAASAYASLMGRAAGIRRVVIFGPAHRVPFIGLTLSSADYFETPLGQIPTDPGSMEKLSELPFIHFDDRSHAPEHSLEVQLPFLQELIPEFTMVPILVGDADTDEVAAALEMVWGNDETLMVVSSDLSHYENYETAKMMDEKTSTSIVQLRPEKLRFRDACGRLPICGLLTVAKRLGMSAETVDLRNSGDTAGDKGRVVGYGAYLFQ
jgi:MEMO1 family protein